MPGLLLALLLAAAIKDGPIPLRSGCFADASVLGSLPSGAPVTIRYSISAEGEPCYKVSVDVDGKTREGYLPASALIGLEELDQARRQAAWVDAAAVINSIRASTALPSMHPSAGLNGLAGKAAELIESSQPQ